ncbi:MAG: hypothetical protein ACKVOU_00980, partial [Cytophagales bacterium]
DVATPFLPIKIELDGSNTVGDQKKMNLGTNGNGYIAVYSRDGQYLGDSFTVKTDTAKVKRNQ